MNKQELINEIKKWGTGTFEEVEDDDYTHTRMAEFVKIPIETLEWILNKNISKLEDDNSP
jgi:hypothetical protein